MNEKELNQVTPFAATNFRNARRVFGIKTDDRRRHMYIIGKTGMGKSTLLENMVYTDIQAGHGVAYVDPHGDTAEKILQWIPANRVKDVIYFNPSDLDHPIAFNVLEKVQPNFRNLVASGLVSVYKKLWADSWGPRLEYILRYCILALLDSPDSTLLGINRMLVDKKYRDLVVARVTDPVVRAFWIDEFSKWNDRVLAEVISPIQNKVGQFLSNSMIRNIVGQLESTVNLREVMDGRKILIMNLSKGRMGEDASALLGAMMITKIQLAAMSRVDIPEDDRKDFYLYVDEFQNFATESFATILSEARKYRLCLTMAHQYIAQLEQGGSTVVRDAVFGNVGTLVTFRVGASDAEFLEREFAPKFTAEDIVNLPKYKIYLRLMIDGVATEPFSADALPALASRDFGHGASVVEYTRKTYSKERSAVEDSINQWQTAEGGVVNPNQLIGSSSEYLPNTKSVLEVYEEQKKLAETKKAKEDAKAKEKAERDSKPIVWTGPCDLCGTHIELKFEPDDTRPILCQEDLKAFRKGSITGDRLEKLMDRVYERKSKSAPKKTSEKREEKKSDQGAKPKQEKKNDRPKNDFKAAPVLKGTDLEGTEQKGRIRIIREETVDAPANATQPTPVQEKSTAPVPAPTSDSTPVSISNTEEQPANDPDKQFTKLKPGQKIEF